MYRFALAFLLSLPALNCLAAGSLPFTGQDLSGVYNCNGRDALEGDYQAKVTLTLNAAQSSASNGGYGLRMEVPGYGVYLGSAVSDGQSIAITFAQTDTRTHDFGTGLGTVSTNAKGAVSFSKFYYEPEFRGGDHGTEDCLRQSVPVALVPAPPTPAAVMP
jgi:hypothetical protein